MELRNIIAISQKKYATTGNIWNVAGSPTAGDGVARTAKEWFDYLNTDTGATIVGLSSSTYAEFNRFYVGGTIEFLDSTIAMMLGYETSVVYPASTFNTAEKWGSSKLVIQNSYNAPPLANSILTSFEETSVDFANNTTILKGFAPISDYENDDDREGYLCKVSYFPASRRNDLKLFLYENGHNVAEDLIIYGLEFKIDNTLLLNLDLSKYSGVSENISNKNLKKFEIGFIVSV